MSLGLQSFSTVKEAEAALGAGARYLGGGTLVVRGANEGNTSFWTMVRATDPELSMIEIAYGTARIGASVTMAKVAAHADLAAIAPAARVIGGPAIRNMATVGGNLFAPAPYGDFAVALLALDATVQAGGKDLPIEAFLDARDSNTSIVSSVRFNLPKADAFRFVKVSRVKPKGVSVVSIAALVDMDGKGTVTSARIALGCMADRPIRARAAEKALVGKKLSADGIEEAAAVIGEGTQPLTDAIGSAWYRAEVLPVHFRRLLLA